MATVIEPEELAARTSPSARTNYREAAAFAENLRPEERMDLTIEEAQILANGEPFELIDGRMVFKMADRKHSRSQIVLGAKLYNYFEQNPIGEVLPEFSLHLWPENKHNFRVPDIAVFLNENLHEEERYETRGPDLAIEVASDDDAASAVFAKGRLYLEKGSRVVWMVFPTEKRVMIMTPTEWRWESDTLTCPELLPGFSIKVAAIFSGPRRKPSPAKKTGAKADGKPRSRRK
jgi:Uma2 family endonuclease